MALQDIVTVNISLQTSGVTQAGFGTPIFIGAHRWFTERVRSYTSVATAAVDLPSGSEELQAVTQAFTQDISPSVVKVGRRLIDSSLFTPDAATAIGQISSISVTGTDLVKVDASFTSTTGSETPTVIGTALVTALGTIPGVTIADLTGTFSVAPTAPATDNYVLSTIARLTQVDTVTETAADVLTNIETEDSDFYFIAAHDHTQAFVLAMGAAVETREKIYFVSIQEAAALITLAVPADSADTVGKLADLTLFRTSAWYHHTADTDFPEMTFIAIAAPADPGKKVWGNNQVAGVVVSQSASGNNLTFTEQNNLDGKNANWLTKVGGITISRTGKVSADEWIDTIRDRDFLKARITEGLQTKQINSPKIPYTDRGINEVDSVVTSVLDRSVSSATTPNILQEFNPFTTTFANAVDVPLADKTNRVLNGSFEAFLAGAIQITNITGTLTFENMA